MLIASWNINGVKARLDNLLAWLDERSPDIVCLQEIKSVDEGFPADAIRARGYDHVFTHGQKGFNGVAILSKAPPIGGSVEKGLPGDETDPQARFIEGRWASDGKAGESSFVRVANLYLPNGNPLGTEKFAYKLAWMERLEAHARHRLSEEAPFVLTGDFNIIPEPEDVKTPAAWTGDALFQPESRSAFRRLRNIGFTDAVRAVTDKERTYTFWDYQAGAWPKNNGIRIDHALLSPEAASVLRSVSIDSHVRGWEKPSDHVPVVVRLEPRERLY